MRTGSTFIIGATLFGSFTKGRAVRSEEAGRNNDFDACIFMDVSAAAAYYKTEEWALLDPAPVEQIIPASDTSQQVSYQFNQHEQLDAQVRSDLYETFLIETSHDSNLPINDYFEGVFIVPISRRMLTSIVSYVCTRHEGKVSESKSGHFFRGPIGYCTFLFMMQIGKTSPQLREYRHILLNEMRQHGKYGENMWLSIRKKLLDVSADPRLTTRNQFAQRRVLIHIPPTLNRAIAVYGKQEAYKVTIHDRVNSVLY